ncbi:type II toxin-antitoxin system PemK/MazF family toxin [Paenibacillus aceti]|uniref:Uncharacterized protein n=1 Tax=Paenibacillus aceti TaxID=1820010 RepID=A0ABQ1W5X3_9BACL|nr:type II toxin-antitoxin system PemK/MazF family toxin [Paenibacillus aceti]GGG16575.1 hypothetical protein GCM10010913_43270 [Paenibacillus aceti]
MAQLSETLQETEMLVKTFRLGESISFLLWNDLLNKHTLNGDDYDTYHLKNSHGKPIRYARGRKVMINFGYGIDRELFQPHPAIVLKDFQELIVVVPTTSDDGSEFNDEVKKAIIQVPSDRGWFPSRPPIFPRDTIINLHQVRVVSKNRVTSDLRCSVRDYVVPPQVIDKLNKYFPYPVLKHSDHLLRTIEMKLAHLHSPDSLYEIKRLQDEISRLNSQIADLNEELAYKQAAVGEAVDTPKND